MARPPKNWPQPIPSAPIEDKLSTAPLASISGPPSSDNLPGPKLPTIPQGARLGPNRTGVSSTGAAPAIRAVKSARPKMYNSAPRTMKTMAAGHLLSLLHPSIRAHLRVRGM